MRSEPVVRQRPNRLIRLVIMEPCQSAVSRRSGAFARASEGYHQRVFSCCMFFIIQRQTDGHNALRVLSGGDGKILSGSLVPGQFLNYALRRQVFAREEPLQNLRGPVYGSHAVRRLLRARRLTENTWSGLDEAQRFPSITCLSAPLSIPPAAMLFVLVVLGALDFEPSSPEVVHAARAQAARSARKSRIKRNPVVVTVSIEGVFPRCRCEIADSSACRASNRCPNLPRYYQRPGSSPVWPRAVA